MSPLFLILPAILTVANAANVLVWIPCPSISHQQTAYPIVKELSQRGHRVTFITPYPLNDPNLTNLTEIDVSFSAKQINGNFNFGEESFGFGQYKLLTNIYPAITKTLDLQLGDRRVKRTLLKEKFDLFIGQFGLVPGQAYLKHYLNCPVISLTSLYPNRVGFNQVGDVVYPSFEAHYYVHFKRPRSFLEKVYGTLYFAFDYAFFNYKLIPEQVQMIRRHFTKEVASDADIYVDLMLSNTHPVFNGARPNYPNVIEIAGMLRKKKRGMKKDLQNYLDKAKNGVIYVSFGSNVKSSTLNLKRRQALIDAFSKLPYKILWKYENDSLVNKPDNVRVEQWLPQVDILEHPNVKLFITQGGIQSFEETVHARKPIVGIPFFADQWSNIDQAVRLGIGKLVESENLKADDIVNAVGEILRTPSYKKRVNEVANLLEDNLVDPLEKVIYWIEYVIRNQGAKMLQSPKIVMDLSWFEYLNLDVFCFLTFVLIAFIYGLYRLISALLARSHWKTFLSSKQKLS